MAGLVKRITLNKLEYNPNRDPAVYRRTPGQPFRIQALIEGSGKVHATVEVDGTVACAEDLEGNGYFTCEISFDTPGVRIATVVIEREDQKFSRNLRLDVLPRAWAG